jgi:hypothetical protein
MSMLIVDYIVSNLIENFLTLLLFVEAGRCLINHGKAARTASQIVLYIWIMMFCKAKNTLLWHEILYSDNSNGQSKLSC